MDLWQPADAGDSPYSMSSPGNNATATGTSSSSSSAAAPSTAVAARASGRRHAKFFGGYGTEESSNDDDEDEEEDNEMLSRFGIAQGGERESSTALGLDLWSIDEVKPSIGARSALPGSDDEDEIQKTIDQVRRSMMDSSATSQHFAANDDGMDLEDFLGSVIDKLRRDAGRAADLQSVLSANTRLQDSSLPSNADALDTQSLFGSNARSLPSSSRSLLTDPLTRDLNLAAPLNDILSHRPGPGTAGAPVSIAPHQTFPAANMFTSSSGAARNAPSYSQPLSPSAVMSILSGSTPAGLAAAGPFNHTHLAASAYPAEFPQIKREQQALHSASFLQPHASTSSSSRSSSQSGPSLPNSTQPGLATLPALSPQPNVGSFPPSAYQTQSNYTSPESDADGPNTASFQQHSRSTSGSNYDLTAPSGKASSSTSTTRAHTAKNSPPGSVKHSRSTSSLEGMNRMVPLSSMTAYDHSRSSDNISAIASQGQQVPPQAGPSAAPDKHTQQASCESSSLVRAVYREPAASPEAQMVLQEGQCQLVVLGLPDEGARSRVETQVKIGLTLLRSRFIPSAHPAASAPAAHAPRAMSFRDPRGALTAEADAHFEKVGSWRYLCLPTVSSVKRNAKKHHRADIPSEQVLYADIKVVSASHPSKQISVCTNCQQREFKRLQRKTQNRNKPADEVEEAGREDEIGMSDEELAKRKIVLFNCGQYLDFNNGEAIIPTRITCYCRHHKEKYGFNIVYTLRDHRDRFVATAMSPPIFLTDDHKARPTVPDDIGMQHMSPSLVNIANGHNVARDSRASSAWTSAASSAGNSQAGSEVSSAASSRRPSRGNSVEALNQEDTKPSNPTNALTASALQPPPTARSATRKERSSKPYNLDSRPLKGKRVPSMNRLNSFTMTPLNLSAPGSPRQGAQSPPAPASVGLTTDYLSLTTEPLEDYAKSISGGTTLATIQDYASPNSSVSAPSTPGAGLDVYTSSWIGGMTAPDAQTSTDESSIGSRSVEQSPAYAQFAALPNRPFASSQTLQMPPQSVSHTQSLAQQMAQLGMDGLSMQSSTFAPALPRMSRIIPSEGPMHGGIEVTILGENFVPGLEVTFGEMTAVSTQAWGANTLVCVLPPSPCSGPVMVDIKGSYIPAGAIQMQLFTYVDSGDKRLMELALQVVGMKMTGRIDDARDVAQRIIGSSPQHLAQAPTSMSTQPKQMSTSTTGVNGARSKPTKACDMQGIVLELLAIAEVDRVCMEKLNTPSSKDGQTMLHIASQCGLHRLMNWLVDHHVDLDTQDANGNTALHLSALSGRYTSTRLLASAGAKSLSNKSGLTPLDVAILHEQADIVSLLHGYAEKVDLPEPDVIAPSKAAHSRRSQSRWLQCNSVRRQRHARASVDDDTSMYDSEDSDHSTLSSDDLPSTSPDSSTYSLSRTHSFVLSLQGENIDDLESTDDGDSVASLEQESRCFAASGQSHKDLGAVSWPQSFVNLTKATLPPPPTRSLWSARCLSDWFLHVPAPGNDESSSSLLQKLRTRRFTNLTSSSNYARVQSRFVRSWGYSLDNLKEDALRSYSYNALKSSRLREDRMLWIFWLPLLLLAVIWLVNQTGFLPTSLFSTPAVLPSLPYLRIM